MIITTAFIAKYALNLMAGGWLVLHPKTIFKKTLPLKCLDKSVVILLIDGGTA